MNRLSMMIGLLGILVLTLSGCNDYRGMDSDHVAIEKMEIENPLNGLNGAGGGFILFENEANSDYNFELYIMNADGSSVTQLTLNPGYDGSPTFSPDLKKIAFSSRQDDCNHIYVFDLEAYLRGHETKPLCLTEEGNNYYPAWSPDGSTIAFASDRTGEFKIYQMKADGRDETLFIDLPEACFPAWSPDGKKIAFSARNGGNSDVYVMTVDGGILEQLTYNAGDDQFPNWSPDGKHIAFSSSGVDTSFDISIMDANGQNQVTLINHSGLDELPKWSPDGRQILFRSGISGSDQLTIMNSDGTNIHAITRLKGKSMPYDWQSVR